MAEAECDSEEETEDTQNNAKDEAQNRKNTDKDDTGGNAEDDFADEVNAYAYDITGGNIRDTNSLIMNILR